MSGKPYGDKGSTYPGPAKSGTYPGKNVDQASGVYPGKSSTHSGQPATYPPPPSK